MINTNRNLFAFIALFAVCIVFGLSVYAQTETNSSSAPVLTEVDSKYVCMVTNKLFPKEQIPVVVSDKTYYGCCEMCKAQLAENPSKRMAVDPVSGNTVDKADSVIGAAPSGEVYYFESEENLNKFSQN